MHYIIKRVPRIKSVNRFGNVYTGGKIWDYKNTMYFQEDDRWERSNTRAKVFEGTWNDARAEAARAQICCTDPNDHEFVGPVEVVLNEDGTINHIKEH